MNVRMRYNSTEMPFSTCSAEKNRPGIAKAWNNGENDLKNTWGKVY